MLNILNNSSTINPSIPIKKYKENSYLFKGEQSSPKQKLSNSISTKDIAKLDEINISSNKILSDFQDFHKIKKEMNINLDKLYTEVKTVETKLRKSYNNKNEVSGSTNYEDLIDSLKKDMRKNLENINDYTSVQINDVNTMDGSLNVVYKTLNNTVLFSVTEAFSIKDLKLESDLNSEERVSVFEDFYNKINDVKEKINKTEEEIGKESSIDLLSKRLKNYKSQEIEAIKTADNYINQVDLYV
jgi:hypothetical protein